MKKVLSLLAAVLALSIVIVFIVAVAKSISDSQTAAPETSTATPAEEKHEHTYLEDWTITSDYHWHQATCGHTTTKDKAQHDFDEGVILKPATEEQHGEIKYTCQTCGYEKTEAVHFFEETETEVILSDGDKLIESKCAVCGQGNPLGNRSEHTFSDEWQTDETDHWHDCTCSHGVTTEKQPHTYVDGFCSVCNRPQNVPGGEESEDRQE